MCIRQGGEPTLLGVDFFRKAVEFQKKYGADKKIENAFQTNGVLLNDDWCSFFYEHQFLIGLSIDGPEKFQNRYRLNRGRRGSFSEVMKGLEYLIKHSVDFNTLTVVQKHNSYFPLEIYNFLKEIDSRFMQFVRIVERISAKPNKEGLQLIGPDYINGAHVSEWSVEPMQFGNIVSGIFDEWVRKDVGQYYG